MLLDMKVILITGTRQPTQQEADRFYNAIDNLVPGEHCVVHGGAHGIDTLANDYCIRYAIDRIVVHANWRHRQKLAGMYRNQLMMALGIADEVWAFPGENSIGTWGMVRLAKQANVPHEVFK